MFVALRVQNTLHLLRRQDALRFSIRARALSSS